MMDYSGDYSYSYDYSYEPMTMNGTDTWEEYDYPVYEEYEEENWENYYEDYYYGMDDEDYYYDDYYYDDEDYDYVDYEIAYMFAPYDWGYGYEWKDSWFCAGVEDPLTDNLAGAFPDEYWSGYTRDECWDWCKTTQEELGEYGLCCGHATYADLWTWES